jgi:hypothetical protein
VKVASNPPGDTSVSLPPTWVNFRRFYQCRRFVPQGLTKVAQHFSAGLTFYKGNVPLGTIDRYCAPAKTCVDAQGRVPMESIYIVNPP